MSATSSVMARAVVPGCRRKTPIPWSATRQRSKGRKMVVVLDNARYHHAKLLQPYRHRHRQYLELWFLPPYSPQLAPVERVWKLARRLATHNLHFGGLEELQYAAESCFNRWRKPNPVLKKLCGIT